MAIIEVIKDTINYDGMAKFHTLIKENELYNEIDLDKLADYTARKKIGQIYLEDNYYLFVIDGLLFTKKLHKGINEFLKKTDKKEQNILFNYLKTKEFMVCETTFLYFTNIPFDETIKSDSLINKVLRSIPHYNFIRLSRKQITEQLSKNKIDEYKTIIKQKFYGGLSDTVREEIKDLFIHQLEDRFDYHRDNCINDEYLEYLINYALSNSKTLIDYTKESLIEELEKIYYLDDIDDENNILYTFINEIAIEKQAFMDESFIKEFIKAAEDKLDISDLLIKKTITDQVLTTYQGKIDNHYLGAISKDYLNEVLDKFVLIMLDGNDSNNTISELDKIVDEIIEENIDDLIISYHNSKRVYQFYSKMHCRPENRNFDMIEQKKVKDTSFYTYKYIRWPELLEVFDDNRRTHISMLLPPGNPLEKNSKFKSHDVKLEGMKVVENANCHLYFVSDPNSTADAKFYDGITFEDFFEFERELDLFNVLEVFHIFKYDEIPMENESMFYKLANGTSFKEDYQTIFFCTKEYNEDFYFERESDDLEKRRVIKERTSVADIYTAMPVRYSDLETLYKNESKENNFIVNNITTGINFQINFEFGNQNQNVRKFHERLDQIDLGTVYFLITEQPHYNYYCKQDMMHPEGCNRLLPVRLVVLVDKDTHTAVLNLYHFGMKCLPTQYLDEISRNTLIIRLPDNLTDEQKQNIGYTGQELDGIPYVNFYKYISEVFKIRKVGKARHLIISPYLDDYYDKDGNPVESERKQLDYKQIQSALLHGKSLYNVEEELGLIIDKNIDDMFESRFGDSIYDYASTYYSEIVCLQTNETYKDYLAERIDFAVVTLLYLEIVQLEEAAIRIATTTITDFINDYKVKGTDQKFRRTSSEYVLITIQQMNEEYAKTIDFKNVQANYLTTKKAFSIMRESFAIEESLEELESSRELIQQIYENKKDRLSEYIAVVVAIVGSYVTINETLLGFKDKAENGELPQKLADFIVKNYSQLYVIGIIALALIFYFGYKFVSYKINEKRHKNNN